MRRWGLPTYPIADGMRVGKRPADEMEWLLDHGFFKSWHEHHLIVKVANGRYRLYKNTEPVGVIAGEEGTLEELIKKYEVPIPLYQWHDNREEDWN